MITLTTKFLTLILMLALVIGLVGTVYQYKMTKTSLTKAQKENKETARAQLLLDKWLRVR